MQTDQTGHELQHKELLVYGELGVGAGEMLGEEIFGKALGVMEKVEGGEVERVGFVFVFLLLQIGLFVV